MLVLLWRTIDFQKSTVHAAVPARFCQSITDVSDRNNSHQAMLAFVGFIAQHHATHKSPIDNLLDHVADPFHVTFATNGVSVPHYTEF
jgi:hypothetical protein